MGVPSRVLTTTSRSRARLEGLEATVNGSEDSDTYQLAPTHTHIPLLIQLRQDESERLNSPATPVSSKAVRAEDDTGPDSAATAATTRPVR
jgi:hypothetical protein